MLHLTCNAVSRSGFGCPPIKRPCLVSVDDTPGTPIPGCAKMSSTDRVTTFFAFVLMIKMDVLRICTLMAVFTYYVCFWNITIYYPYLNRVYFMPLSVAKVESVIRFEYGSNWTSTVIDGKCHSSVNHLKFIDCGDKILVKSWSI